MGLELSDIEPWQSRLKITQRSRMTHFIVPTALVKSSIPSPAVTALPSSVASAALRSNLLLTLEWGDFAGPFHVPQS